MLRDTWAEVRRSQLGLLVWFLLCVFAAVAYVLLATPEFLATAQVVLEPRQPEIPTDPSSLVTAPTLDSAQADSRDAGLAVGAKSPLRFRYAQSCV